jgi:hypothetical protein
VQAGPRDKTAVLRLARNPAQNLARNGGPRGPSTRRSLSVVLVGLVAVAMLLVGAVPAFAALSSEQEALARKIDGELIAPCCWTQTVADHQSDIAA